MKKRKAVSTYNLMYLASLYIGKMVLQAPNALIDCIDFIVKIPLHLLVAFIVLVSKNEDRLRFEERFRIVQEQILFKILYRAALWLHGIPSLIAGIALLVSIAITGVISVITVQLVNKVFYKLIPKKLTDLIIRVGINPNNIDNYCEHDANQEDLKILKNYLDNLDTTERLNLFADGNRSSIFIALANAVRTLNGIKVTTRPDILRLLLSYPEIKASLLQNELLGNKKASEQDPMNSKSMLFRLQELNRGFNNDNNEIKEILNSCDPSTVKANSATPDVADTVKAVYIAYCNKNLSLVNIFKQTQISKNTSHDAKPDQLYLLTQQLVQQLNDDNTLPKDVDATIGQINMLLIAARLKKIRRVNLTGLIGNSLQVMDILANTSPYEIAAAALVALGNEEAVDKLDPKLHDNQLVKAAKIIYPPKEEKVEADITADEATPKKSSAVREVLKISNPLRQQAPLPVVKPENENPAATANKPRTRKWGCF